MGLHCAHRGIAGVQILNTHLLIIRHMGRRIEGHLVGTANGRRHILVHKGAAGTRLIAIFRAIRDDVAMIACTGHARPAG